MIEIWHGAVVPDSINQCLSVLSKGEMRRYKQLQVASKAREFAYGRAALRLLLGRALNKAPTDVSIMADPHGKPFCSDSDSITFNLSHSQEYCTIALCKNRPLQLGIDIEVHRDIDEDAISKRYFSEQEQTLVTQCDTPTHKRQLFFNIWSRKESIVKAHGKGIGLGLQGFSVSADDNAQLTHVHERLAFMQEWQLTDISANMLIAGASACLCCETRSETSFYKLEDLIS